jgi:hypothetical protein
MKRYLEFIKEAFFSNLEDYELQEKLQELEREKKEIEEEILQINQVLKDRQEESVRDFLKDWPESIFDLNEEQLKWLFQYGRYDDKTLQKNFASDYRNKISNNYFKQLVGVSYPGPIYLELDYSMNDGQTDFKLNPELINSIKILGNYSRSIPTRPVTFYINFNYLHKIKLNNSFIYENDENIYYGRTKYNSIESILQDLVRKDIKNMIDE